MNCVRGGRGENFTADEVRILTQLVLSNSILKSYKSDVANPLVKEKEWKKVAETFQRLSGTQRSSKQLRTKWKRLKARARILENRNDGYIRITAPTAETRITPTVETRVRPTVETRVKPTVETTVRPFVETKVRPAVETTVKPTAEAILPSIPTVASATEGIGARSAIETTVPSTTTVANAKKKVVLLKVASSKPLSGNFVKMISANNARSNGSSSGGIVEPTVSKNVTSGGRLLSQISNGSLRSSSLITEEVPALKGDTLNASLLQSSRYPYLLNGLSHERLLETDEDIPDILKSREYTEKKQKLLDLNIEIMQLKKRLLEEQLLLVQRQREQNEEYHAAVMVKIANMENCDDGLFSVN